MSEHGLRQQDYETIKALKQEVADLRARLEKAERDAGWQPIDTAPMDGTVILGYRSGKMREAYRVQRDDCEMWVFGGASAAVKHLPSIKPTHWMPLPNPPVAAIAKERTC